MTAYNSRTVGTAEYRAMKALRDCGTIRVCKFGSIYWTLHLRGYADAKVGPRGELDFRLSVMGAAFLTRHRQRQMGSAAI